MATELRQVGEFSSFGSKRLIRSSKNPMDKCTIVSIYPRDIEEIKHTIEPGKFLIPAGTFESPSTLVVGGSSWWRELDAEQPMVEIPNGSVQIAESVINDYTQGLLGVDPASAKPGLFFVLGEVAIMKIKLEYKTKLEEVRIKQDNWFKILVRIADALWARTNGNPLAISDDMRLAARCLNFNDKPWLKDFNTVERTPCKGCGNLNNPLYPVCPICKTVDMTSPLAKDLKFAV